MHIPEKYKCDICGEEINNYSSGKYKHSIPVITDCEWDEGRFVESHVVWQHYDLCKKCIFRIANVKVGFRGSNPKVISDKK